MIDRLTVLELAILYVASAWYAQHDCRCCTLSGDATQVHTAGTYTVHMYYTSGQPGIFTLSVGPYADIAAGRALSLAEVAVPAQVGSGPPHLRL